MTIVQPSHSGSPMQWQTQFLLMLPAVQSHARIQFRRLRADRREDAVQEAIASACVAFQRLASQGRLDAALPSTLADFAVRRVRGGRRVGSRQNSQDVHSASAQAKHGLQVQSLTPWQAEQQSWHSCLVEDRRVWPSDLAAFRVDFAEWLRSFPLRHRRIITALASGEPTAAAADRFGLTAGRVSQLRRSYERNWRVFQGEVQEISRAG
jgi:hypothetical protein